MILICVELPDNWHPVLCPSNSLSVFYDAFLMYYCINFVSLWHFFEPVKCAHYYCKISLLLCLHIFVFMPWSRRHGSGIGHLGAGHSRVYFLVVVVSSGCLQEVLQIGCLQEFLQGMHRVRGCRIFLYSVIFMLYTYTPFLICFGINEYVSQEILTVYFFKVKFCKIMIVCQVFIAFILSFQLPLCDVMWRYILNEFNKWKLMTKGIFIGSFWGQCGCWLQ